MISPKPDSALVIVGHGSTINPWSSAPAILHAEEIRRRDLFGEVVAAFWKEQPSMREVYHMLDSRDVYVVPDFISEGYFTREIIPRELRLNPDGRTGDNFGKVVKYCDPVGSHQAMTSILLKRAQSMTLGTDPGDTTLVIVGHGTGLNENSAEAIRTQVEHLKGMSTGFDNVLEAYMEEAPFVSDWQKFTMTPNVVFLPFFISDGLHSYQDIPEMIGLERRPVPGPEQLQPEPVQPVKLGEKTVFLGNAIGSDPGLADVILNQVEAFDQEFAPPSPRKNEGQKIESALKRWFDKGLREIGEISIVGGPEKFELTHIGDRDTTPLDGSEGVPGARAIARFDDSGRYRSLHTAPGLRRGWKLSLAGWGELRRALDEFYPAALGTLLAWENGTVEATPLRETLGRQTGMYRSTRSISDSDANSLIHKRCGTHCQLGGCVRKIQWKLDDSSSPDIDPSESDPDSAPFGRSCGTIPMVCTEACSHLISAARKLTGKSGAH